MKQEKNAVPEMKAPGTPKTPMPEKFPTHIPHRGPTKPAVKDPPVPNRAHTEMRSDFPPEFPSEGGRDPIEIE